MLAGLLTYYLLGGRWTELYRNENVRGALVNLSFASLSMSSRPVASLNYSRRCDHLIWCIFVCANNICALIAQWLDTSQRS